MYDRLSGDVSALHKQFVDAVHDSIRKHCAGVVKQVPTEEIDALSEQDVILIMTGYVFTDVMELGLCIMCWRHVAKTVREAIAGVIAEQRRRMDEDSGGEEKASTL